MMTYAMNVGISCIKDFNVKNVRHIIIMVNNRQKHVAYVMLCIVVIAKE